MGNQQQNQQNFNPKEWTLISTNPNQVTLWQNNHNRNIHIEEYIIYTIDQEQFGHQRQLYFQRKNHPYWVAAYYFQQQQTAEICVNRSIAHIFIQKIPIKIFDLRDLPIPDLIHTHYQCLEGFKSLAQWLGCFRVQSQFIGVNQKGIVKVWAGPQWSQIGIIGHRISQEEMVKSVIESLQSWNVNVDQTHHPLSLKTYLYRSTDRLTFDQAIHQLRNFSYQFNQGFIPSRLQSLYNAQHFDMFLDPLLRSNHYMQHSKHISSTNLHQNNLRNREETTFRRVESGDYNNAFGRKVQAKNQPKAQRNQTFLGCMNDQQKLNTSNIASKEEVLRNYYAPQFSIKNNQNAQFQQLNTPPNAKQNPPNASYAQVQHHQNTVSYQVYQKNPINGQNHYQNYFTNPTKSNIKPQNSNQVRTLPSETLDHKASQPNLSQIQIKYNNPANISNFHSQTRPISQFNNATAQKVYEPQPNTQVFYSNQQTFINRSMANQTQTLPPVTTTLANNQIPPKNIQNQPRKRPIPESIIMELYTSQDKLGPIANEQYMPLKTFGLVKQSISGVDEPQTQLRFDSATLIKDEQNNILAGVPHNYYLNTNSKLNSIQELSSEHYKYDNLSQTSSPSRQKSQLFQGWGQSGIKRYDPFIQANRNQGYLLDLNDGKTPQNLMKSIRELSNSRNGQNYIQKAY